MRITPSSIRLAACCAQWKTPVRLTSSTRRQSAASISRNGFRTEMPAFATSTSTPPSSSSTRANARSTCRSSATSQRSAASSPSIRSCAVSTSRSPTAIATTRAPSCAKRRLVASPIPLVPPVTTTRLPSSPFTPRQSTRERLPALRPDDRARRPGLGDLRVPVRAPEAAEDPRLSGGGAARTPDERVDDRGGHLRRPSRAASLAHDQRAPPSGAPAGRGRDRARRRPAPAQRDLPRLKALGEIAQRDRVAVLDRAVRPLEELEEDVGDADRFERPAERLRAEVEEVLVAPARVDVDRAQPPQCVGVALRHPDGVPREPARPHVFAQAARPRLEGQLDRAVVVGRVAGRHRVDLEQRRVARLRERGPRAEVLPEALVRAVVRVP